MRAELARLPAETRELLEELRRLEGEGANIEVELDPDSQQPRMRVRVHKPLSEPHPPTE